MNKGFATLGSAGRVVVPFSAGYVVSYLPISSEPSMR
jgi:hypothetical protein